MYENQTTDAIRERMLENVSNSLDKREGSIIHDALAPTAIELELLYAMADYFLKNTFGDTADREYLIERALERGLEPYPATNAIIKGQFSPASVEIAIGSRFSCEECNYSVTEKVSDGVYLLKSESAGIEANLTIGNLLPINYTAGLQNASIIELAVPGEDEEETEHFRERYLRSFNNNAYGGNIADYKEKVNAIAGVGGVKVYPAWQGGGTVRISFMTSDYGVPSQTLVDEVQTLIDPVTNHGEGIGIAPIGHRVTVGGVTKSAINIGLNITFGGNYTLEDYQEEIIRIIDGYFDELNKGWENTQKVSNQYFHNSGITVYISQIESRILNLEAVMDISSTKLNGQEKNLVLGVDELATRGEVTNAS